MCFLRLVSFGVGDRTIPRTKKGSLFSNGPKTAKIKQIPPETTLPKFNEWNLKMMFGISYSRVPFSGEPC